jgi:hypothetical protein
VRPAADLQQVAQHRQLRSSMLAIPHRAGRSRLPHQPPYFHPAT